MQETAAPAPRVVLPGAGRVIQLPGASIEFKVPVDLELTVAEMTAGEDFPGPGPHIHRVHHELFYVLEGRFDFLIGDAPQRVEAGAFIDVPAGILHDFRNPGPGPARLLGIAKPGGLQVYFEEVEEQLLAGTFTPESFEALRLRYDTDEVPVDWSVSPRR